MMHPARTDTLWPTLPRSPGCSMLQWRKTSPSAALSISRGKKRLQPISGVLLYSFLCCLAYFCASLCLLKLPLLPTAIPRRSVVHNVNLYLVILLSTSVELWEVGGHGGLFWCDDGVYVVFFRYKAVIDACSLQPDIDLLPFGDQTEIGERVCTCCWVDIYVYLSLLHG